MPLILNNLLPTGANVWVWHVTETNNDLKKLIPTHDFLTISSTYTHPQRFQQKAVSSILLNMLGEGSTIELIYNESGKPYLENYPGSISISHSKNFVGLLYHPLTACGLDLEEHDERILRISPRFLNKTELDWIHNNIHINDIGLIWSVKEALYKNIGGGGILFKEQLVVLKPEKSKGQKGHGVAFYIKENMKKRFEYHFMNLEDVLLVHTIARESAEE